MACLRSRARFRKSLTLLLAPLAPHLCEELWKGLGRDASLANHA
jgi:leucyl-tRNA synthetase